MQVALPEGGSYPFYCGGEIDGEAVVNLGVGGISVPHKVHYGLYSLWQFQRLQASTVKGRQSELFAKGAGTQVKSVY